MGELISLIVPVYNGEKWLEQFFRQFEEQTYDNIELILVDDGSTDLTPSLIDEYADGKRGVVVCHKKNGGPSSARNRGLEMASGKYVAFADVDDRIYPAYIEYLYHLIVIEDADMSVCSYMKMTEKEDHDKYLKNKNSDYHVFCNEEIIHHYCYRKYINGYSYLKLIKTEIAKQVYFPEDIVFGEDYIYIYEVLKRCRKVVCGEQIEYIYIQFVNSSTHQKKDNTLEYQKAWVKHLSVLEDVKCHYYNSYGGILEKCYLLALNNTTRLYNKERDQEFFQELFLFIKENSRNILRNKEAKIISRILGLLGTVDAGLVIFLCGKFFKIQEKAGMTFRQTQ